MSDRTLPSIVEIEWIDSMISGEGWAPVMSHLIDVDDMRHLSCGYLIHEDESKVVLAHSQSARLDDEWHVVGAVAIPQVAITGRKVLWEPPTPMTDEEKEAADTAFRERFRESL